MYCRCWSIYALSTSSYNENIFYAKWAIQYTQEILVHRATNFEKNNYLNDAS